MTKDVKLTYRLSKVTYEKLKKSADERHISVNAEINRIIFEYFEKRDK